MLEENRTWSLGEQVARARAGDAAAFAVLVRAHQRTVYSLAVRMLGNREQAEDLAQEVFLQLHGRLASIESEGHLVFWLRRVTTHRAIDHLRQTRIETPLDEDALAVEGPAGAERDPILQRHLARLILQLAPKPRAVLLLRYQEDLDPVDIGNVLDMSVNTVKSHLKRSLAALRGSLPDFQEQSV